MRRIAKNLRDPAADTSLRSTSRRWLFPSARDIGDLSPQSKDKHPHIQFYDPDLNLEQTLAIQSILNGDSRPICLDGPAGTGKTKTLVEAVLQICDSQPSARILVCAPSNAAADTVARRLAKHLDAKKLFRLQSKVRSFPEVPAELLPYCFVDPADDKFGLPPWNDVLKFKVVVCSCLDASILMDARLGNVDLIRLKNHYSGSLLDMQSSLHWTHLLVDEAGQASEPETLVPISVISPGKDYDTTDQPVVLVLVGDVMQLPAIIMSPAARSAELDVSLLERLTWSKSKGRPSAPPLEEDSSIVFLRLLRNYRSHPAILMAPSTLFYNDRLEPAAKVSIPAWRGLLNPSLPLVIRGIEGGEEWIQEVIMLDRGLAL